MAGWLTEAGLGLPGRQTASEAAAWLLDNRHVVDRAAQRVAHDLPEGYYRLLPSLATGDQTRPPRIYDVARHLLEATSLQLTDSSVTQFVLAYQSIDRFELAELWALPTMLRLTCLETLVGSIDRLDPDRAAPFAIDPPKATLAEIDETERVARAVRSLTTLNAISWPDFVEATSAIDAVLHDDPAGAFSTMDEPTRDTYRRAVEKFARGSCHDEHEVARRAVASARGRSGRQGHVGYWLVAEGRPDLERAIGFRLGGRRRTGRWMLAHATAWYLAALVVLTLWFALLPTLALLGAGESVATAALPAALLLLPASMPAMAVLHWVIPRLTPPRVLPKLGFDAGIPAEHRTAVVVPCLLTNAEEVRDLLARLERHRLSNPDPNLRFVLLTDFGEADEPDTPQDSQLLEQAVTGVAGLNRRAGPDRPFHLLHRGRRFNPGEVRWMGWERKRGKLEELNRLLLGDDDVGFQVHEGDPGGLDGIRYVITLDADTMLGPGTAARLVGTIAHPLNRPEFDAVSGRIRAGYTIVQPRVEISPESGSGNWFTRLFCGDTAVDIYSRAVSDVYQDVFGAGIYVGKAVYDVAAFTTSLAGRVPENAVVSHDLFEGIHGRVGLATDIVVYEDYPPTYFAFARRLHRWVRGDWQLVPWLRNRVPGGAGDRLPNRFGPIDRWKVIDNLRRSLLPAALLGVIVSGWTWLPGHPLLWTVVAVLAPAHHLVIDVATGVARHRSHGTSGLRRRVANQIGHWFLFLAFLPHRAWVTGDAIVRTVIRLAVTRRHLLEWTTAAQTATITGRRLTRGAAWREMAVAPLAASAIAVAVGLARPTALPFAAPLLVLWAASPEIALRISRPRPTKGEELEATDRAWLRAVARRTWFYFESFVSPDRHWLPPDNFQEDPDDVVAERTSPTNIAMLLLSTLAAYDLGYVGLEQLTFRLRPTLRTIDQLERYRGHLLNWYDVRTLAPLEPRYVSTVDSGNLAAALLAIETGLDELVDAPIVPLARWQGLVDTITVFREDVEPLVDDDPVSTAAIERQCRSMVEMATRVGSEPDAWARAASGVEGPCREIERVLLDAVAADRESIDLGALHRAQAWVARIHGQIRDMQQEIADVAPWLDVLDRGEPPAADGQLPDLADVRNEITRLLPATLPLGLVEARCDAALTALAGARARLPIASDQRRGRGSPESAASGWLDDLDKAIAAGAANARRLLGELRDLAAQAERLALEMDFGLLYDPKVRQFFLGYNLSADQMDPHHYDLLASEARLASFVAIATGDVPVDHWFALGRPLTRVDGVPALLSWGGTMFEYLMPPLLLRSRRGTLLGASHRAAVAEQRADARRRGTPWGISESGYAVVDAEHIYQYRAFGVQGLGLKRGLDEDLVVAPYATALALPLVPRSATENLNRLGDLGMIGRYGFYEAVDFTPGRVPEGRDRAIVRSYMAHHQGMVLAAIDNALFADALARRFGANPRVRAIDLLAHERVPDRFPVERPGPSASNGERPPADHAVALNPWRPMPRGARPAVNVLGNGRLATRVTEGGSGGLSWRRHAITRARPDTTLDDAGPWIYVRDRASSAIWSVGRQPVGAADASIDAVFHAHMVELHRRQHGIAIRTDIAIGPADDIEVRRLTVVNETDRPRSLTFTSYGEVVLAPARDDARHPAFSKLFVESRLTSTLGALVFSRRSRDPVEQHPVMLHHLVTDAPAVTVSGYETDRERFLGRNGSHSRPRAIEEGLSGALGSTLDPIMAIGAAVELAPFATEQLAFVTAVGPSLQAVTETATRYDTLAAIEWLITDARTSAAREAGRLGLEPDNLPEFQELLSTALAPGQGPHSNDNERPSDRLGQPGLWGLGISGDDPIVLVETEAGGRGRVIEDLFRAHQVWRRRGVAVDLVVIARDASGYQDTTWDRAEQSIADLGAEGWLGRRAGIHLVRADQIPEDRRRLLTETAAAIIDGDGARLADQLAPTRAATRPLPPLRPTRGHTPAPGDRSLQRPHDLRFDNGLGGFSPDGRDYVIHLEPGQTTPAPWCNVLANERFGTLVTESGGGYTWAGNSGEYRLTPWTNDPVLDPPSESIYLRDEETVDVWSPTPGPARSDTAYQVRHGAGYTEWRNRANGIESVVRVFVDVAEPVKVVEVRLRNDNDRPQRLTATYYAQWLLGRTVESGPSQILVDYDPPTRSLRARNRWNPDYADKVAFLTSGREPHGFTADRTEFFGHEGDPASPAALQRVGLSGRIGPGIDPCACLQIHFDVGPGEEVRTHFVLGAGESEEEVTRLIRRWRDPATVAEAIDRLDAHWDSVLSAVTISTPEPALDVLVNRWALYQVLSSRVLGRTGFYQSSGAFGFRDQLQDLLALLHVQPERARAHILECAGRQFEEGDVLHWWHPPNGPGVRTRCSDDLLWLPFVTARYVEATGDIGVLDEPVPFLSAPPLERDERERFGHYHHGDAVASLHEHCQRALECGVTSGPHGLPLIGDGDWNDGMDRLGSSGRGESIWLGWFAGATALAYAAVCERLGRTALADTWRDRAGQLFTAVEAEGWDGDWYRRAIDDDGQPLGSATSEECRIDSIAQSWAVLSAGAEPERAGRALRSARSELVRDDDGLACLLWPPFDLTTRNPGYIKAYPPGIRENGGQYSHAAAWLGWAFAEIGDGDEAVRILRMLNPIERAQTPEAVRRYRLEPYAVAADIASVPPHVGRGGWNWYTGAAAWTWRLAVEAVLGLRLLGDQLRIDPHLPLSWPGYRATLHTAGGSLDISVTNDAGEGGKRTVEIELDGRSLRGNVIDLPTDYATHGVAVLVSGSARRVWET
ncbi:MAG: glucoamylase family protein [Actinomycetota bacterium]